MRHPFGTLGAALVWSALAAAGRAAPPAANAETAEDEKVLQAAKVAADGPSLLQFLGKRTVTDADRERIAGLVRQLGDSAFAARQKASEGLVACGPPALGPLRRALEADDVEVRHRARDCIEAIEQGPGAALAGSVVRLVRARQPAGACPALLAFLPFADDDGVEHEVLAALAALGVRDGKLDPALAAALRDPDPQRRAAAALVAGRSGEADQQAAVRALLADPDARVRLRAAQGLLAARDKSAVPVLTALLADAPLPVAEQAEDLLGWLAGGRGPRVSLGADAAARRKCREAWETWWRANKAALDLKHADTDLPGLDAAQRTREVVRQFLNAVIRGDQAALNRTTDVPFYMLGQLTVNTRDDLSRFFAETVKDGSARKMTFTVANVVPLAEYAKVAPPDEKNALENLRQPALKAVYIYAKVDGRQDNGAVFVRVTGGRVRVIGIGQGQPPK
jgi:HEAT repeat protein